MWDVLIRSKRKIKSEEDVQSREANKFCEHIYLDCYMSFHS